MKNGVFNNKQKNGLSFKIILILLIFSIVQCGALSAIGYMKFTYEFEKKYTESANNVAETALSYINADKLDYYAQSGEADEEYYAVLDLLDRLTETADVSFIYVGKLADDYQTLTYIYDTVNSSFDFSRYELGYTGKGVADQYVDNVRRLMTDGEKYNEHIYVNSNESGLHTTAAAAVRNSKGEITAYLAVEKKLDGLVEARGNYILQVLLTNIAITAVLILFVWFFLKKFFIKPLNTVINETRDFSASVTPSEKLKNFGNNSEIGNLAHTIYSMECDINRYYDERAERERQQSEMEVSRKANEARTDFMARISHDMRTPMTGILGLANLMRDKTDLVEIRSDLDQIETSGKYMLHLINDTLDVSKIEAGKMDLHPAPAYREKVFANVVANAKMLSSDHGINLIVSMPRADKPLPVITDATRLEQILMNIVSNAVKYTKRGGRVELKMETISSTDEEITDRYIIRDNGIGMSKEFLSRLFEPFSQEGRLGTDVQHGTGLGMSIVKTLVQLMNGGIDVNSRVNEGTEVVVVIRFKRFTGNMEESDVRALSLNCLENKRVLLCEDHPLNAQIAEKLLERKNMVVDIAENGAKGVEIFEKSAAGFYDVILMDIRMPVMNGLDAARAIRSLNRSDAQTIPIIAMTANAFDEDVKKCLASGMNEHLSKPIEPEIMYQTIAKQLNNNK